MGGSAGLATLLASWRPGVWGQGERSDDFPVAVRVVRNGDVPDDRRIATRDLPVRWVSDAELRSAEVTPDDTLVVSSGYIGKSGRIDGSSKEPVIASNFVRILRPAEALEPSWLYWLLGWSATIREMNRCAAGTSILNLQSSFFSDWVVPHVPPLAEQRAIATVLDSIDEAVERTEEVIAATERLRDAMLHDLLTRGLPGRHSEWKEVRGLGALPACWDVTRLGDVAEVKGGKRLPKGDNFAEVDTGLPYIRVVDFLRRSIDTSNIQYLRPDTHSAIARYTVGAEDVYISIAGTIGLVGRVPPHLDGANLTENAAKIVTVPQGRVSSPFLVAFLDSHTGQRQIDIRINALGQPKLALERIRTIPVPLPSLHEQWAIASVLDAVDAEIEGLRGECGALEATKASVCDALLTGQV